ncbi:NADH-quinone oxidoreductase subunit K [Sphingobacterium sp. E70]|uniref:NADH-quinone oxidoreductase subunit K n=1 Tax=Sphingobacterium sp. E70 TaxID=2853439 RepID=UPI00359C9C60
MELILVLLIGILYAAGIYLILRRSMVKLLLGIMLLGNGTNILIFCWGILSKASRQ